MSTQRAPGSENLSAGIFPLTALRRCPASPPCGSEQQHSLPSAQQMCPAGKHQALKAVLSSSSLSFYFKTGAKRLGCGDVCGWLLKSHIEDATRTQLFPSLQDHRDGSTHHSACVLLPHGLSCFHSHLPGCLVCGWGAYKDTGKGLSFLPR